MNKVLMLIIIPCLMAYVMAMYETGYPGYGYGAAPAYGGGMNFFSGIKSSTFFNIALLFVAVLVLKNVSGIAG